MIFAPDICLRLRSLLRFFVKRGPGPVQCVHFSCVLYRFLACVLYRCLACVLYRCLACVLYRFLACVWYRFLACVLYRCLACVLYRCLACVLYRFLACVLYWFLAMTLWLRSEGAFTRYTFRTDLSRITNALATRRCLLEWFDRSELDGIKNWLYGITF